MNGIFFDLPEALRELARELDVRVCEIGEDQVLPPVELPPGFKWFCSCRVLKDGKDTDRWLHLVYRTVRELSAIEKIRLHTAVSDLAGHKKPAEPDFEQIANKWMNRFLRDGQPRPIKRRQQRV